MAARAQNKVQGLLRFCKLAAIFLLISGLLIQKSFSFTSYTRQEILDIGLQNPGYFTSNLHLIPELTRTPNATQATRPTGSARRRRRDRNQRRGKCRGLKAKLKLTTHRLSLPSIFLTNVQSLANKMDEIRLAHNKRFTDCNVMIFTETWLHSEIPDNAIELSGQTEQQSTPVRQRVKHCAFMSTRLVHELSLLEDTAPLTWSLS